MAVLVVPAERDPGELLRTRRPWYTFPPPTVTLGPNGWRIGRDVTDPMRVVMPHWALPLWWDGALVPEGWDRARRVAHKVDLTERMRIEAWNPTIEEVIRFADLLVKVSLAPRVVRLARVDGRLVEAL